MISCIQNNDPNINRVAVCLLSEFGRALIGESVSLILVPLSTCFSYSKDAMVVKFFKSLLVSNMRQTPASWLIRTDTNWTRTQNFIDQQIFLQRHFWQLLFIKNLFILLKKADLCSKSEKGLFFESHSSGQRQLDSTSLDQKKTFFHLEHLDFGIRDTILQRLFLR